MLNLQLWVALGSKETQPTDESLVTMHVANEHKGWVKIVKAQTVS